MISLSGIGISFPRSALPVRALDAIDLEIGEGEFVALTGLSGSGKSTLLDVLALLAMPDSGEYRFDGRSTRGLGEAARLALRRGRIGYIFQDLHLVEHATVVQNIALGLEHAVLSEAERRGRLAALLERFGMTRYAGSLPSELPKGQRQCIAIARAVIAAPPLLLADEPLAYLDVAQSNEVMGILRTLHKDGTTVVVATHSSFCAAQAMREVQLNGGRIAVDARLRGV